MERGVQFQGAIFCAGQWVGELGAQGQEQEGCYKNILDEGQRRGQQDEQREELTPRKALVEEEDRGFNTDRILKAEYD